MGGNLSGDVVLDFSDPPLPGYFGKYDESITLEVQGTLCTLYASGDRPYLSPRGRVPKILETHAQIKAGQFKCGSHPNLPTSAAVQPCMSCVAVHLLLLVLFLTTPRTSDAWRAGI